MADSHNDFPKANYHPELDESTKKFPSFPAEENSNQFLRYVSGNKNEGRIPTQQTNFEFRNKDESFKRNPTETSQMISFDAGFKKMKFNQVEALKELKQEYEILRKLPIEDQVLDFSHARKNTTSIYSSESENTSGISSSKQSRAKVRGEREAQIL